VSRSRHVPTPAPPKASEREDPHANSSPIARRVSMCSPLDICPLARMFAQRRAKAADCRPIDEKPASGLRPPPDCAPYSHRSCVALPVGTPHNVRRTCGRGGTGRHTGLKILRRRRREGSSPSVRTRHFASQICWLRQLSPLNESLTARSKAQERVPRGQRYTRFRNMFAGRGRGISPAIHVCFSFGEQPCSRTSSVFCRWTRSRSCPAVQISFRTQ
jgi:hypothetical protein